MSTGHVSWGRSVIAYDWRVAPRRTLAIRVHPDLSVTVVAPTGTDPEKIRERVHARAAWILRARSEFSLYLPALPPRQYVGGESHRYLGRLYRLRVEPHRVPDVRALRGVLVVRAPEGVQRRAVRDLVEDWYRRRARTVLPARVEALSARVIGNRGPAGVVIRTLTTRWGTCSPSGVITLNQDLIRAPLDCIDYVVAHELCHLNEHNHGPKFWALLNRIMPDWRARREQLNRMTLE